MFYIQIVSTKLDLLQATSIICRHLIIKAANQLKKSFKLELLNPFSAPWCQWQWLDSNPQSLDDESSVLPLFYRCWPSTPHLKNVSSTTHLNIIVLTLKLTPHLLSHTRGSIKNRLINGMYRMSCCEC
jgi:hypothetical protein